MRPEVPDPQRFVTPRPRDFPVHAPGAPQLGSEQLGQVELQGWQALGTGGDGQLVGPESLSHASMMVPAPGASQSPAK